jgi:uncharacterized protein YehS (DUF1456 family)
MTNNDILKRLRYILNFNDSEMVNVFKAAECNVTTEDVSCWLKTEDDADYEECSDWLLATFLNGLINHKRGKREGAQPKAENTLTNNLILKKLKIAFNLQSEEILEILKLADIKLSKHELSAFFRRPEHKHYRECLDQVLRNFLTGLQKKES